jgi:hypothetical protein
MGLRWDDPKDRSGFDCALSCLFAAVLLVVVLLLLVVWVAG